jgi:hypothetical protein
MSGVGAASVGVDWHAAYLPSVCRIS